MTVKYRAESRWAAGAGIQLERLANARFSGAPVAVVLEIHPTKSRMGFRQAFIKLQRFEGGYLFALLSQRRLDTANAGHEQCGE